jgi:hypothetical protein
MFLTWPINYSVSILNRPHGQTVFKYKTGIEMSGWLPCQAAFCLPLMVQYRVRQISGRKPWRKAAFCVPKPLQLYKVICYYYTNYACLLTYSLNYSMEQSPSN